MAYRRNVYRSYRPKRPIEKYTHWWTSAIAGTDIAISDLYTADDTVTLMGLRGNLRILNTDTETWAYGWIRIVKQPGGVSTAGNQEPTAAGEMENTGDVLWIAAWAVGDSDLGSGNVQDIEIKAKGRRKLKKGDQISIEYRSSGVPTSVFMRGIITMFFKD